MPKATAIPPWAVLSICTSTCKVPETGALVAISGFCPIARPPGSAVGSWVSVMIIVWEPQPVTGLLVWGELRKNSRIFQLLPEVISVVFSTGLRLASASAAQKVKGAGMPLRVAVIAMVKATLCVVELNMAGLILGSVKSYKKCSTAPDQVFIVAGAGVGPDTLEKVIVTFKPSVVVNVLPAPLLRVKPFQLNHHTEFFRTPLPESAYWAKAGKPANKNNNNSVQGFVIQ